MQKDACRAHTDLFSQCGSFSLAEASVAVPFVGAATRVRGAPPVGGGGPHPQLATGI